MAEYSITGVWKGDDNIITHYALHEIFGNGKVSRADKTAKAEAIKLVEKSENNVTTWIWNYQYSCWGEGEKVHVVNGSNGKFLRSNRDSKVTDNLDHLINYDWL